MVGRSAKFTPVTNQGDPLCVPDRSSAGASPATRFARPLAMHQTALNRICVGFLRYKAELQRPLYLLCSYVRSSIFSTEQVVALFPSPI